MLNLYNLQNSGSGEGNGENKEKEVVPEKKADFSKYVDPRNELSHKNIKWGVWFAKNRILLYRLLIIFLSLLIAVFWILSLYKWAMFFIDWPNAKITNIELSRSENYNNINPRFTALPLQVSGVQTYQSGVKKQDIIAEVNNPNKNFIIFFDYYFSSGENKTEKISTFLLPQQSRPIPLMGAENIGSLSSPSFVMEGVLWKRVDPHKIPNVSSYQKEHLNFVVSDVKFIQEYAADTEKANAHVITFKIKNNSPYDYKSALYYVGLYRGGNFVGVRPINIDTFKSLETKDIDLRIFATNLIVDQVVLYPIINIYDKEAYLEPIK